MSKQIPLIAIPAALALAFWLLARPWVGSLTSFENIQVWIAPLVALILLSSALSLAYMILPMRQWTMGLAGLVAVTYLIVFGFHWLTLIGFAIIMVFHAIAVYFIRSEIDGRIKLDINRAVRHGMRYILLPLMIAISFGFYLNPTIQERIAQQHEPPPSLVQSIGKTFDSFLQNGSISEQEKKETKQAFTDKLYDLYENEVEPYRKYFPPVLAFGLFILLWGLSFIFVPLAVWTSHGMFFLLRKVGFVTVSEVDVKAQRISL